MASKVYVSGFGVVSSLGIGVEQNLKALKSLRSGITSPTYLTTIHQDIPVGELKVSNKELSDIAGITYKNEMSRTILLGLLAVREAINTTGIDTTHLSKADLISGTSVGGMDISELKFKELLSRNNINYQRSFQGHDCGYSTEYIARHLGINGNLQTISTACSSSANSIMNAGRMIKAGLTDRVIAGGTDALTLFTLNGFNALKILDDEQCKPFDIHRKGLNLGEGAAYLVLESENALNERKGKAIAELVGYGNANDAYHQTASSPTGEGAFLAMKKALNVAGLSPASIDYVNAHGTGTVNNDISESQALKRIFKDQKPAYSSTKGYTGHTLAAAGAIEAVFSLLTIGHQTAFANINLSSPMDLIHSPVISCTSSAINHVLSNSFGFGGNCSSLIFSKIT